MAKKIIVKNPYICGNCALGKFVDGFLDHAGKPILLTCRYEKYAILRTRESCNKFKPKNK
jgi:hypothetical protein